MLTIPSWGLQFCLTCNLTCTIYILPWVLVGVLVNFPQKISKGQRGEALSLARPFKYLVQKPF